MIIYTVIPFFSNGIEIFQNDIKSFMNYDDAYDYATRYCSGKTFEIIENELVKSDCSCGGKKINLDNGFSRCNKCDKLFA